MRKRDEATLTSTNVVLEVMNTHKATWKASAPVAEAIDIITEAMTDIEASRMGAGAAVSTGVTKDKHDASADAIDSAIALTGYARVLARKQRNNALRDQLKMSRKKLEDMPDDALPAALQDIYDRLIALGMPAVAYGVTTERLATFEANIDAYNKQKDAPRTVIVTRKGVRTNQPALMKTIRDELKDLDALMPMFAEAYGGPQD